MATLIEDSLWKLSGLIMCVVLLFIVPTYLNFERQEDIVYHHIVNSVEQFSEKIREVGYVDQTMINQLNADLASSGYTFKMEFEHLEKRFSEDQGVMRVYYDGTYTDDILPVILQEQRYYFHIGDFFFITVKNSSSTKTQQIRSLLGIKGSGPSLYIKSGGIIRYGDT